jgi:hypothetical protein
MKRRLLGIVLSMLFFGVRSQGREPLLDDFLGSKEFYKIKDLVSSLGEVNLSLSKVTYAEEDNTKPLLTIIITDKKIIKGMLEAVAIPQSLVNVLPEEDNYAMQLVYYDQYDIKSRTGVIKTVDLNYDGYTSARLQVSKGEVKEFLVYPMPAVTKTKYAGLKKVSDINTGLKKPHVCDRNQNGNVGFGECMGCMQQACNGTPSCSALCSLVNIGSLATNVPAQCGISMGAACVIISIMY